jgi:hypothetical protein
MQHQRLILLEIFWLEIIFRQKKEDSITEKKKILCEEVKNSEIITEKE